MRILHTADWHLGQNLMFKDRRQEHVVFLDWLLGVVSRERIEVLIIAGDVFDTGTPPNYALEMYYSFLVKVSQTSCKNVVVVGGNHDSVSTLHAPRAVLSALNISVVGGISASLDDEIIRVRTPSGQLKGLVCAIPYLRDRDIRKSVAGESYEQKNRALLDGVRSHYRKIRDRALEILEGVPGKSKNVPIVATGHLSVAGGLTSDGVREIYVGSLGEIEAEDFPNEFNYVALGHLHYPQRVNGCEHIRYSGSPIPLSFGEADTPKEVVFVNAKARNEKAEIRTIAVPEVQRLRVVSGNLEQLPDMIESVLPEDLLERLWLEVKLDADPSDRSVEAKVKAMVENLPVELFAIKRIRKAEKQHLRKDAVQEQLWDLKVSDIFEKRLAREEGLSEDDKDWMRQAFNEVLNDAHLGEEDRG